MAIRLQKVISSIANEDQVRFIKGRKIASHLRLLDDLTKYRNQTNKPGVLIALDCSKAFNTLSKPCILGALEILKFGPKFQMNTVVKNSQSCVHNGGWISSSFSVERGIRQGCPLCPLLFTIAVEILAMKIRNS